MQLGETARWANAHTTALPHKRHPKNQVFLD